MKGRKEVRHIDTPPLSIGPRMKSQATFEYEKLIKKLVDPKNWGVTTFKFNSKNELVCYIGAPGKEEFFSVTQIFRNKPDFEHLSFDEATIANIQKFYENQSQLALHEKFSGYVAPQLATPEKGGIKTYTEQFYTLMNLGIRQKGVGPLPTIKEVEERLNKQEKVEELLSALKLYEPDDIKIILWSHEKTDADLTWSKTDADFTSLSNANIGKKLVLLTKDGAIHRIDKGKKEFIATFEIEKIKEWSKLLKEFDKTGNLSSKGLALLDKIIDENPFVKGKLERYLAYKSPEKRLEKNMIGPLTLLSRDWLITSAIASTGLSKNIDETKLFFAANENSIQLDRIHGNALIMIGPINGTNEYNIFRCSLEDKNKLKAGTLKLSELKYGVIDTTHVTFNAEMENMVNENISKGNNFVELARHANNYHIVDALIISIKNQLGSYQDCDLIQWEKTKSDLEDADLKDIFSSMKSDYAFMLIDKNLYFFDKINNDHKKMELSKDDQLLLNEHLKLNQPLSQDNLLNEYLKLRYNQLLLKENHPLNLDQLLLEENRPLNWDQLLLEYLNENTVSPSIQIRHLTAKEIDDIVKVQIKNQQNNPAPILFGSDNKSPVMHPPRINKKSFEFDKTETLYRVESQNPYITNVFLPDLKDNLLNKGYKLHSYDAFLSTSLEEKKAFGVGPNKPIVTVYEHPIGHGKNISSLSAAQSEKERLFPPGTQVLIHDFKEEPDKIYIYAKFIRSLDNVIDPNSYSSQLTAIREKYIQLKDNLKSMLTDRMNEKLKETKKLQPEIGNSPNYIKFLERAFDQDYQKIDKKLDSMIELLGQDHSLPDHDEQIEQLNFEIYKDLSGLGIVPTPVIDLLPTPLKLSETFNHYPFKTSNKDLLDNLKSQLQYALSEGNFNNEAELILHQSLMIMNTYAKLLRKSSFNFFEKENPLAEYIRNIMKNVFDLDLPSKLDSNKELNINLSPIFQLKTNLTLDNLVIKKTDTVESALQNIESQTIENQKSLDLR